jgi:hypothetical protein
MHPKRLLSRNNNMRQKQSNHNILEIDPPAYLKEAVFERIVKERQKQIFRKKLLYFSGFSVSVIGLFASLILFVKNIATSDFWNISSLVFTDMKVVVTYWQEFSLSLLETFPVEAFTFILMPLLMLMILIKEYNSQSNYNFPRNYKSATNLQIN